MASPRTRRTLQELRPQNDNNVSLCIDKITNVCSVSDCSVSYLFRVASSVVPLILNGLVSPMVYGSVWIARANIEVLEFI